MVEITLLELRVDDATFTANAPFSRGDDEEGELPEEGSSSKGAVLGALVGLVFLVVVAAAAKRRLGGDEDPIEVDEIEA